MSKKLVVVESPAKAKTIGKYLGREFTVVASIGHVRDLPKSNKHAIDLDNGFKPHYEISPGKEKVVAEISRLAKKADEVLLATDPDREGEAIAWHIAQVTGLSEGKGQKAKVKRIVFHEITESAIKEALEHPRAIDNKLRHAQEARRVLDRLFGYDLSGLIWKKLRYGLSAGRVQSPALRILVEREREIKAFIPEKFWVIEGDFTTPRNELIKMTYAIEPKTEEETKRVVAATQKAKWQVGEVTEDKAKRSPRAPFTTSTLQQAASSRLGYSPSITMRLAQRLYEAGHITYMRTDSTNLSGQALGDLGRVIESKFGNNYYRGPRQYATRSKNAQEAHEAIRPTKAGVNEVGTGPEARLYKLIWSRAVASQMVE
ncbi:MAG: type I DNA topoisomerase, partial [Patescibacteria group bacterium]